MKKFTELYPNEPVRALSWKQPFASLMLHGKIETRTWDTKYRGWVLICASKAPYNVYELEDIAGVEQGYRILKHFGSVSQLKQSPTEQAIAIGRLVESRPMIPYDSDKCFAEYKEPWTELRKYTRFKYNDISGRIEEYKEEKLVEKQLWCHVYQDVQPIDQLDWKGSQGWKTLDQETKDKIVFKQI